MVFQIPYIKIIVLHRRYAPDNEWFIRVMNEVFELGGNMVEEGVAFSIMRLIGEGERSFFCLWIYDQVCKILSFKDSNTS